MRVSTAFPTKFLKPEDIGTKRPTLTIARVTRERIGDDEKLVVWFEEARKGLPLNKTNATTIARQLGDETDTWPGRQVTLGVATVDFRGSAVPAIRVQVPVLDRDGDVGF